MPKGGSGREAGREKAAERLRERIESNMYSYQADGEGANNNLQTGKLEQAAKDLQTIQRLGQATPEDKQQLVYIKQLLGRGANIENQWAKEEQAYYDRQAAANKKRKKKKSSSDDYDLPF